MHSRQDLRPERAPAVFERERYYIWNGTGCQGGYGNFSVFFRGRIPTAPPEPRNDGGGPTPPHPSRPPASHLPQGEVARGGRPKAAPTAAGTPKLLSPSSSQAPYHSPRADWARFTHSAAPTLPAEPAAVAAGLRRGPQNSYLLSKLSTLHSSLFTLRSPPALPPPGRCPPLPR